MCSIGVAGLGVEVQLLAEVGQFVWPVVFPQEYPVVQHRHAEPRRRGVTLHLPLMIEQTQALRRVTV